MRRKVYIYEQEGWPEMSWDLSAVVTLLSSVRHHQGRLRGYMEALGFAVKTHTGLLNLTQDVLKSSEIEGEFLDAAQVRSSIARKLGLEVAGLVPSDRHVDGVVEMMLDATQKAHLPLSKKRLCAWHAALFPTGRSGMHKITVGDWRKAGQGPMQVVSGALGKERVHFEAPSSKRLPAEMKKFLAWFNGDRTMDPVLKSALAHFWFVTIHPFDDGNGRIARAIADLQLTRSDAEPQRFYSMSAQIRADRKGYYEVLEKTQKGTLDITAWIKWYLGCLQKALEVSERSVQNVLAKTKFWDRHSKTEVNERQRKMINMLFDGFEGHLHSSKWAKITKCSSDTALRDIQDLVNKKILKKASAGGRSTHYELAVTGLKA